MHPAEREEELLSAPGVFQRIGSVIETGSSCDVAGSADLYGYGCGHRDHDHDVCGGNVPQANDVVGGGRRLSRLLFRSARDAAARTLFCGLFGTKGCAIFFEGCLFESSDGVVVSCCRGRDRTRDDAVGGHGLGFESLTTSAVGGLSRLRL